MRVILMISMGLALVDRSFMEAGGFSREGEPVSQQSAQKGHSYSYVGSGGNALNL